MSEDRQEALKKSYATPTLTIYGDVRKITENIGVHGNLDGAGPPNQKTSL
jgi:hypothetical protein